MQESSILPTFEMLIDRLGNIEEKQAELLSKMDGLIAEQNMTSLDRKWATFFRNLGWIVSLPGGMDAMSQMREPGRTSRTSPSLLVRTATDKETNLSVFIEGKQGEHVTYERLKKRCEALFELNVRLPFAVVANTPVFQGNNVEYIKFGGDDRIDGWPILGIICYDINVCYPGPGEEDQPFRMGPWAAVSDYRCPEIWCSIFINLDYHWIHNAANREDECKPVGSNIHKYDPSHGYLRQLWLD